MVQDVGKPAFQQLSAIITVRLVNCCKCSFSVQKVTSKSDLKKGIFLAPNGSPKAPQGDSKIIKIRFLRPSKTHLRKSTEKVTKKSPNLTPSTCVNCVRGLKNRTFRVFRKSLQIDVQNPPFWMPFGLQNREKVVLGRYPKKIQK